MAWSAMTLSEDGVWQAHWYSISVLTYHTDIRDRNGGPEWQMPSLLLRQNDCPSHQCPSDCGATADQLGYDFEFIEPLLKPKLSPSGHCSLPHFLATASWQHCTRRSHLPGFAYPLSPSLWNVIIFFWINGKVIRLNYFELTNTQVSFLLESLLSFANKLAFLWYKWHHYKSKEFLCVWY